CGIQFVSNITPNIGSQMFRADGVSFQNEYVINDEQLHAVPAPYELTIDNSFLLFRKDFEAKYRSLHKGEKIFSPNISSLASQSWSEQPPSVRMFFKQLENKALKKHKDMFPNYQYKPQDANFLNSWTLPLQSVENSGPSPETSTTNVLYLNSQDDSQDVVHDINTFFANSQDVVHDINTFFTNSQDLVHYINPYFTPTGLDYYNFQHSVSLPY
ncbi:33615_t:CDS:2, partial [Racocetra persica]